MNSERQQEYLQTIRSWAGCNISARPDYLCMSIEQLKKLEENRLFAIGSHSSTHAALAFHDKSFQEKELTGNKIFLEKITNQKISTLAYPYGSYNCDTIDTAISAGFTSAFTTDEESVSNKTEPYRIGRFQVRNQNASKFGESLERWLTM